MEYSKETCYENNEASGYYAGAVIIALKSD